MCSDDIEHRTLRVIIIVRGGSYGYRRGRGKADLPVRNRWFSLPRSALRLATGIVRPRTANVAQGEMPQRQGLRARLQEDGAELILHDFDRGHPFEPESKDLDKLRWITRGVAREPVGKLNRGTMQTTAKARFLDGKCELSGHAESQLAGENGFRGRWRDQGSICVAWLGDGQVVSAFIVHWVYCVSPYVHRDRRCGRNRQLLCLPM